MVKVKCPFPDCALEADNDEAVVTAALLNIHATVHTATSTAPATNTKADKLKRPSVSLAGQSGHVLLLAGMSTKQDPK